uniref:hypothetical protein n=1 Tax=Dysgonomonas capnocytophagoides TaxID=45254 RepID=UPI002A82B5AD
KSPVGLYSDRGHFYFGEKGQTYFGTWGQFRLARGGNAHWIFQVFEKNMEIFETLMVFCRFNTFS